MFDTSTFCPFFITQSFQQTKEVEICGPFFMHPNQGMPRLFDSTKVTASLDLCLSGFRESNSDQWTLVTLPLRNAPSP